MDKVHKFNIHGHQYEKLHPIEINKPERLSFLMKGMKTSPSES